MGVCAPFSTDGQAFVVHGEEGCPWDWTEAIEQGFVTTKRAVQQAQALQVVDPGRLFARNFHVTQGIRLGPLATAGASPVPVDFGPNCGKEQRSATL